MRNKPKWHSVLLIGLSVLLASLVVGCGPTALPVIVDFSAVPSEIESGESVTLSWNVTEVASVSIQGIGDVPAVGMQMVSPTTTVTYTLTASNADGNVTKSVVVTVTPQAAPGDLPLYPGAKVFEEFSFNFTRSWSSSSSYMGDPIPFPQGVSAKAYEVTASCNDVLEWYESKMPEGRWGIKQRLDYFEGALLYEKDGRLSAMIMMYQHEHTNKTVLTLTYGPKTAIEGLLAEASGIVFRYNKKTGE